MTDESKAESFGTLIIFLLLVAIVVTAPVWGPIVDEAMQPKPIMVVECKR